MKKAGYNTRAIALDILMKYEKEGDKLRPLLLSVLEKNDGLERRDRAFIKNLTEGTVERLITLDWIIDQVSSAKTGKMKDVIRMIIRMGAYQLVFMDHVPDRAAVSEAVKLAGMRHMDGLKGFVNGVLRAVARYRDKGISYPDIKTEFSCPDWIEESFTSTYGKEKAESMIRAGVGERPVYIRVNRLLTDTDSMMEILEKEGVVAEKTGYPYTLKAVSGQLVPSESESFAKGLYSVQDLSSQIAMYELWDQIEVYINKKNIVDINIIDLCAAPGGKSCFIAAMKDGEELRVRAFDISEKKLEKIKENVERAGIRNIDTEIKDASLYDPKLEGTADAVIADLPCSGLGVMGRKVDIKYRIKPDDIVELCKLQRKMLDNAVRYLKPGGVLLFSVCTVTKEETAGQSEYLENAGLARMRERVLLQGVDPCDGFYYSVWTKHE